MLFAGLSAEGWAILIVAFFGAVFAGIGKLYEMHHNNVKETNRIAQEVAREEARIKREQATEDARIAREAKIALEVLEVKRLQAYAARVAIIGDEKMDDIARTGEIVHELGNSAMLAAKLDTMEANERAYKGDPSEENKIRLHRSRRAYEQHLEEQKQLEERLREAANKRASQKLEIAKMLVSAPVVTSPEEKKDEKIVEAVKEVGREVEAKVESLTDAAAQLGLAASDHKDAAADHKESAKELSKVAKDLGKS